MNTPFSCREIADGILFCSVSDQRFKTNRISVNIVTELSKDSVTVNALIPQILKDGFEGCKIFTELYRQLEELYGASIDADVQKRGDRQILTVCLTSIDDRFALEKEEISHESARIITRMLLHPSVNNGGFDPQYMDLEKTSLSDTIDAEINEKRSYAINHLLRKMCAEEPYGIPKYGFKEDLDAITPQTAYQQYQKLLSEAQIVIFFTGCGDGEAVYSVFEEEFSTLQRKYAGAPSCKLHPTSNAPVIEERVEMDVNQAKMVLGFSGAVASNDSRMPAMRMMSMILGGMPSSKLFVNVRERLSLCYYCVAMLDSSKGIMLSDCGVEEENAEMAKKEILAQLTSMKNGEITEAEIQNARLALQNAYNSVYESDYSIESFYMGLILNQMNSSPEEEKEKLNAVTMQDIVDAASLLQLEAVYLLVGKAKE